MVIKVYSIPLTVTAGSPITRLGQFTTPTGINRKMIELRITSSVTTINQVYLRVLHETEQIVYMDLAAYGTEKLPIPLDVEVPAGQSLYFEASNAGGTDASFVVTLVYEETRA